MSVESKSVPFSKMIQLLSCFCCCLLISGLYAWQLPTAKDIQNSLESCQAERVEENAAALRCLVEQLGLWTDELGYNARRIAKIFAAHNQMEELTLVVNYCNKRERREEEPAQWAYEAYKCATSGRFGKWIKDYYLMQQQTIKLKPEK